MFLLLNILYKIVKIVTRPEYIFSILRYNFRLLDTSGWNFRHAHYHEEGRRTLYKAYGIKFVIIVQGMAGQ